jgi:hypothetical protein
MPLLGIFPKESKSAYNRDTYAPMFIVVLFTKMNQPRYPSTDEWIKTIYIQAY